MVILRTVDFAGTTDIAWYASGSSSLAVVRRARRGVPGHVWLVAKHLKHGMGTVRALGEGRDARCRCRAMTMDMAAPSQVGSHRHTGPDRRGRGSHTAPSFGAGILLAAAFGDFSM